MNTQSEKSGRNSALHIVLRCCLGIVLLLFTQTVLAGGGSTTYYANLTISKTGETGKGKVYYATSNSKPSSETSGALKSSGSTTSGTNQTYYWWVDVDPGYNVTLSGKITAGPATAATLSGNVACAQSSSSGSGTSYSATANIVAVTVNSVSPTTKDLAPTNPSADYSFTVTFSTSNLKTIALDLNKSPETTDGKFTITNWALDGTNVVATGKFNGGGTSYGGASRNNSTTVSLQSKAAGSGVKSCTVTANFPALEFVNSTETDVFTTTTDATKTGTAEFNFNYGAEDDFPTTPTFTHTSGAGAFTVTGYEVAPDFSAGTCKVTVNYVFNPNGTAGTTKEELKVTSVGGLVSSVTVTGEAEAEATDDAKVIKSDGVTVLYQGDWATALTTANANASCTLQLLRNVDLGTLAATQSVTATFTLDLNGKILSGTVSSSVPRLLYVNKASRTLTIMDSKTGGKISATGSYANALYCVQINNGNVILNSGTIEIENTNTSQTNADRLYATGVYVNSGKTFTMNGGTINARRAARDAYGIYVAASATAKGIATINNGTVNVNSNTYAYGIRGYGDIIINNGTINAETLTGAYAFGVYVRAAASATASSGYAGSLTMSGGTINSTATTSYAYGIYMQTNTVGTGETETPEGTHNNQECGVLKITGGTVRVINNGNVASTNQYAYGIYMDGDYSSKSAKHITQTIKNLNLYVEGSRYIYGIYAAAGAQTNSACNQADVALTDNTVEVFANQSTQAYAVYVGAASRTIYTAGSAVYAGEYATAAKVTINSGTYTARTTTTTAYAVASATRAKTTFAPDTTLGGNAEAYPTIIIKGGEFNAYPTTTTARAVSSGGNTTITGGTFNAIAGTSTAYGIYSVAGDLNVTGVEVNAEATGTAVGVYVDCAISTISGFSYYTNATLKNLTVNATTRTGTEADGVMIANYKRNLTPATLKSDSSSNKWSTASYLMYEKVYNYGEFAVAPKCTIIGGTYTAKAATTTAYGVRLNGPAISADSDGDGTVAVAYGQLDITGAEINAQTNGTTTCHGVWTGGPTTITNSTITAESKTTTCRGLLIEAGKTIISGSTINATGTATVQGIYVNARIAAVNSTQNVNTEFAGVAGMECIGELEATNNTVNASATSGNSAYGIFIAAVKGNTASGPFAGDHAIAGKATINSGTYKATATGTTAYGIGMSAQQIQGNVLGRPECHVVNGKFYGLATGGTDGSVDANGQMNYFVLSGGYYNKNTNLSKFVEEGKNINDVLSGSTEYTEGYRYTIGSGISGSPVCKVYQGTTEKGSYATLKEALQYVNANQSTSLTIVMIANHTLPKGNYTLPSKATLVIPNSLTQKQAMGTKPTRENVNTPAPVQLVMLTFDKGVNMSVYGTIEATAVNTAANGGQAITGAPTGNYGRLHLVAGSKITLESGANLNCWGYTTGKGEITAMSGSTVREGFQLGYWRGGSATSDMLSNKSSWHAFPVTDYFIQNVEAPINFRPGSTLYGYSGVNVSIIGIQAANDVKLVGTSGAMFLMDPADASEDTYVRKEYDPSTDRSIWTVNSGAKIGNFSFSLAGQTVNSADYYLPISNNMTINVNEGEFTVTQDVIQIPGSVINISKLGKLTVSSGKRLFVMDNEDWPGFKNTSGTTTRWYYNALYSPSWTTNPRTTMYPPTTTRLPDAEIFVHGTTEGQYYTTEHGANIHSTNEDAGVVRFVANAGANTSIKHIVNTNCDLYTINFTSAQLKNEDTSNPYTPTTGTVAGDAYTYMDQQWVNVKENGCLLTRTDGTGTHQLAHPSDVVAVVPNSGDNAYHSETGSRNFVFAEKAVTTAGCVWWEAEKVTSGTYAGDYMANQEQFDNYGGYYYWDSGSGYWKPRYVTITWKNYDGSALDTYNNVIYNTSPRYTGATPKVPANTSVATYAWTGWRDQNGNEYDKNDVLPRATSNMTYTAIVPETKYEYLITFKNDANKVIHTEMFEAGTVPVCPPEKLVKDPTASQVFTFTGWNTPLVAVTGPATYTAQFTGSPRPYTVTFVDYDMTFLADTVINYGSMAAYPESATEPYRESTEAFSYEWLGWTKALATVTKDITYIAKYKQTTLKYTVIFKSNCWGQNDGADDCVEKIHSTRDYALEANPVVPANPSRPQTAQYTFAFDHWDPAVGPVAVGGATYTAVYTKTPRTYNITYKDKNNATFTGTHGSGYPTTHTYNTATTLVNPTRTGYDFEGWYSVADCSSGKITAVPADVAAVYTVYANWTPKTNTPYTVKHYKQNIDGTYNATPDDTDNLTGTTATSVTPDRKTYTGFNTPSAQTKTILADGSLVITYQYTRQSFKLTWALAGGKVTVAGTGAAVDATGSPNSNVKYDDAITTPTVARTGYTFAGWDVTPATKMPAVATTYTAQWTPITYDITYKDKNNDAFSGTHGSGYPTTHTYGTATPLVSPTKTGYTFGGWYTDAACEVTKVTSLAATGYTANITLYAKWTINSYTLTWNRNGGNTLTGSYTSGTIEFGTAIVAPDEPTRTGYTFGGWSIDGTNAVTPATTMPAAATTYIALWTINTYAIVFKSDDGSTTYTNPAKADNNWDYNSYPSFTGSEPTKATTEDYEYEFDGWSTSQGGSLAFAKDAALPKVGLAGVTYYAHFIVTEREYGNEYALDIVDWTLGDGTGSVRINMNTFLVPSITGKKRFEWTVQTMDGTKHTNNTTWTADGVDAQHCLTIDGLNLTAKGLLWLKVRGADDAILSRQAYRIPFVITENTSISTIATDENSVIWVKAGVLTVNADKTAKKIIVCPGAELKINASRTLTIKESLVLRTEAFSSAVLTDNGTLNLDGGKLYYSRIVADKSQSYQLGLPFDIDLTKTKFSNGKDAKFGTHYGLEYYDGAARAQYGSTGDGIMPNWKGLDPAVPANRTLHANTGYQLISGSDYYYEILFPVSEYTVVKESDNPSIDVHYYTPEEGEGSKYNVGWNFLASPFTHVYTCTYTSVNDKIQICEITENNSDYYQYIPDKIYPASPFFYQASEDGILTFGSKWQLSKNMRRRVPYGEDSENAQVETEWIRLHYGLSENNDIDNSPRVMMDGFAVEDQTNIFLHPDLFSLDFDEDYDGAKWSIIGKRPFVYVSLACGNLAFSALPDSTELIPLTVFTPREGEMRFAVAETDFMNRLGELWLLDMETGEETNLLATDYTYYAENNGTEKGRFFLRPVIRAKEIATDTDNNGLNGETAKPQKIMIDGYLYILMPDGKIFSATGQRLDRK